MRRSVPRSVNSAEMPVNRPEALQIYVYKNRTYKVKYVKSKRGQLFFDCETAFGMYTEIIAVQSTLDAVLQLCQLHAVKNADKPKRRSAVKPAPNKPTLTKQVYSKISKTNIDPLDTFLEFTAPCGIHDLGMDFGSDLW